MFFFMLSIIFCIPPQIFLLVGSQILPIDYAVVIIQLLFILIELILTIRAMLYIGKKQTAVFYLRNASTITTSEDNSIKTSAEIEEELYYYYPHLMRSENSNNYGYDAKLN
jgi:hypothetical protein